MTYQPKKGDRVRVTIESEVAYVSPRDGAFDLKSGESFTRRRVVSIEKIEPPVVQYGPGDVVRGKRHGIVRALGEDGYIILNPQNSTTGRFFTYGAGGYALSCFNSKTSELVAIP